MRVGGAWVSKSGEVVKLVCLLRLHNRAPDRQRVATAGERDGKKCARSREWVEKRWGEDWSRWL